jgi:peptidase E
VTQRQIIALGGGGFSVEPENPALELYILQQAQTTTPRVCFIPTASGDSDRYVASFYSVFSRFECKPRHLTFFQRTPELRSFIFDQDVIYVGGGNTKSMLAVWKDWGLDALLREAWERGIVLCGISAGAICWFQQGITDSFADDLVVLECLGFLKGSCCPHFDGEVARRPSYHSLLSRNQILPGYALDDGAGIHFVGDDVKRVVVSRPNAKAYRMQTRSGSVIEEPMKSEFVG